MEIMSGNIKRIIERGQYFLKLGFVPSVYISEEINWCLTERMRTISELHVEAGVWVKALVTAFLLLYSRGPQGNEGAPAGWSEGGELAGPAGPL